jgi:hypothetical protein
MSGRERGLWWSSRTLGNGQVGRKEGDLLDLSMHGSPCVCTGRRGDGVELVSRDGAGEVLCSSRSCVCVLVRRGVREKVKGGVVIMAGMAIPLIFHSLDF